MRELEALGGVELADWWEDFHLGSDDDREAMLQDLRATQLASSRNRRESAPGAAPRGTAAAAASASGAEDAEADADAEGGEAAEGTDGGAARSSDAPRKRRRRRRKPATGPAVGSPDGSVTPGGSA